jgi:hypothetical protein
VAVFHESEKSSNDISLRRRYGIHLLYVKDFGDIPLLLTDAQSTPGPQLASQLKMVLSRDRKDRNRAHEYLIRLGPAGKRCASDYLKAKIPVFERTRRFFELSEVAYSLGMVDPSANKEILMELVDRAVHADPVGRALTVLRPVLNPSDIPKLKRWLRRIIVTPLSGSYVDRIPRFLEYLITYVRAKYRS